MKTTILFWTVLSSIAIHSCASSPKKVPLSEAQRETLKRRSKAFLKHIDKTSKNRKPSSKISKAKTIIGRMAQKSLAKQKALIPDDIAKYIGRLPENQRETIRPIVAEFLDRFIRTKGSDFSFQTLLENKEFHRFFFRNGNDILSHTNLEPAVSKKIRETLFWALRKHGFFSGKQGQLKINQLAAVIIDHGGLPPSRQQFERIISSISDVDSANAFKRRLLASSYRHLQDLSEAGRLREYASPVEYLKNFVKTGFLSEPTLRLTSARFFGPGSSAKSARVAMWEVMDHFESGLSALARNNAKSLEMSRLVDHYSGFILNMWKRKEYTSLMRNSVETKIDDIFRKNALCPTCEQIYQKEPFMMAVSEAASLNPSFRRYLERTVENLL